MSYRLSRRNMMQLGGVAAFTPAAVAAVGYNARARPHHHARIGHERRTRMHKNTEVTIAWLTIANRAIARLVDQRRGPDLEVEPGGDEEVRAPQLQGKARLRAYEV